MSSFPHPIDIIYEVDHDLATSSDDGWRQKTEAGYTKNSPCETLAQVI